MLEQLDERLILADPILGCDADELKTKASYWTAREIDQQPRVWGEAFAAIESQRAIIDAWLNPLLAIPNLRVVLVGAGTSSFVGDTIAPWLRKKLGRRVDSVSTTDIVGDPGNSFAEDIPTLMISCARSGESPESTASVDLADEMLTICHHLVLTCNAEGYLAKANSESRRTLCLLMPSDSHDRSFAMTSSFTSMLVSCAAVFAPDAPQLDDAVKAAAQIIAEQVDYARQLADRKVGRLVMLGAGCLFGTAREATLKSLELSAGNLVALYDTPLGFRHGPKLVVDAQTLVIHLQSTNPHTARYDEDLLSELMNDYDPSQIVSLSPTTLGFPNVVLDELWISLPYVVFCQLFAFFTALAYDVTADKPCPSGEVNRVVQGVKIYDYEIPVNKEFADTAAGV